MCSGSSLAENNGYGFTLISTDAGCLVRLYPCVKIDVFEINSMSFRGNKGGSDIAIGLLTCDLLRQIKYNCCLPTFDPDMIKYNYYLPTGDPDAFNRTRLPLSLHNVLEI